MHALYSLHPPYTAFNTVHMVRVDDRPISKQQATLSTILVATKSGNGSKLKSLWDSLCPAKRKSLITHPKRGNVDPISEPSIFCAVAIIVKSPLHYVRFFSLPSLRSLRSLIEKGPLTKHKYESINRPIQKITDLLSHILERYATTRLTSNSS
jgi:hypothetical protein